MIVGGNIDHVTRVMTTAIALETSKGDLALALGPRLSSLLPCRWSSTAPPSWLRDAARQGH
jgi:tungstate transport system permease protein